MSKKKRSLSIGVLVSACMISACTPQKTLTDVPITTASEEARNLYVQGRDQLENVDFEKAAALLDQAIQKDPKFALAYLLRSQSGGGYAVAQENRNKAVALAGLVTPGERLIIKYEDAQATGQTAQSKVFLDSLLTAFPMDKRIQYMAGLYYRTLADLKSEVKYYEKAVAIDSNFAPPYNNLGYGYFSLDKAEAAEKAFKTYMRLLPASPNPVDSYAEFLRMSGRFDESIAQYKKVLDMDPSFTSSISGIGDCYLLKGDLTKAREYYREYIEKSPQINTKLGGYYSLAASFVQEGDIPGAVKALEERRAVATAQKQYSQAVWTLANEGFVMSMLGVPQEGLKKLQEATDLAKTAAMSDRTRENLLFNSNNWLGFGYAQTGNFQKSKELLAALSKDVERRGNPGESDMVKTASGYLALKEGKYDEAIQQLSSVPESPSILYWLALANTNRGDKGAAKKMTDKLARLGTLTLEQAVSTRLALGLSKK